MSGVDGDDASARDRERLTGWWAERTLLRPDRDAPSTVDLARALASLCGVEGQDGPRAAQVARAIGPAEHLVLVLVDGLGLELVEALPPGAFLRRHLRGELRAVYPSATAAALTSLATGLWPAQHAVPGWWTHLPSRGLTVTSLPCIERWSGEPFQARGLTPAEVFPAAPLLARYRRDAASVQPAHIADSTYSRWVRGATAAAGYEAFEEGVDATLARVRAAPGPTYTYLYTPAVDALAHACGPDDVATRDLVQVVDEAIARLAAGLGDRGRVVVSADHGFVRVGADRKHLVEEGDDVASLLRCPPTGEPRAPLLHVRPGELGRVRERFTARFGERFALLDVDAALGLDLFGPDAPTAEGRARLGDLVAVARGEDVLLYRERGQPSGVERLVGYHGGLLPAEMRIPLVVA